MRPGVVAAQVVPLVDRVFARLTVPHRQIGASVFRLVLGTTIALLYLQNLGWRRFLWGPHGLIPFTHAAQIVAAYGPNLYLASPSAWFFEAVFWTGLVASIAFACGRWIPVSTLLCAVLTWCLIYRDGFLGDAGWNLATILLVYALVLDCGRYLVAGKSGAALVPSARPNFHSRAAALLHNFGITLAIWQVSLLYGTSCFYKITGHKWQDGTALYYILRSNQFNLSPLGPHIYHSAALVCIATYATLLLQAAFPFCIWQRPAKYVVALGAIGFHVGIAVTMGLPFFSLVMISCEALVFSDAEYRLAVGALRAVGQRCDAVRGRLSFAGARAAAAAALPSVQDGR